MYLIYKVSLDLTVAVFVLLLVGFSQAPKLFTFVFFTQRKLEFDKTLFFFSPVLECD